jgi:hypothetical protein
MLVLLLAISGLLAALSAVTIIALQHYRVATGRMAIDPEYDGPGQVSFTLLAIIRYAFKRSVHARRFLLQYVAHLAVRIMYYIDKFTTFMYSKSRNWFVRNAVRNRGTVPHFWEHLKVYKQEMDREKEDDDY